MLFLERSQQLIEKLASVLGTATEEQYCFRKAKAHESEKDKTLFNTNTENLFSPAHVEVELVNFLKPLTSCDILQVKERSTTSLSNTHQGLIRTLTTDTHSSEECQKSVLCHYHPQSFLAYILTSSTDLEASTFLTFPILSYKSIIGLVDCRYV